MATVARPAGGGPQAQEPLFVGAPSTGRSEMGYDKGQATDP